jgi:hypothetical protein
MKFKLLLLTATVLLTLAGCATVKSVKLDQNQPPQATWDSNSNEGLLYFLPTGYIEVSGQLSTNTGHYTFSITPIIQPDYRQPFLLRPDFSAWAHDTFQLTVSNGLLCSINSSNSDQTGAVVVKLAETAGVIAEMVGMGSSTIDTNRLASFDYIINLSSTDNDDPNSYFAVTNELGKHGLLVQIPQVSKPIAWKGGWENASGLVDADKSVTNKTKVLDGIFYRAKFPYLVTIKDSATSDTVSRSLLLPNSSPVLSLVPRRSTLITRTTALSFQDGSLTSVAFDKPSTALAWFSLPLDAVKAFLSAPAEIIQIKLNYANTNQALTQADNTILVNQLAELKSRIALLEFQRTNTVPKP